MGFMGTENRDPKKSRLDKGSYNTHYRHGAAAI
jgi:hypothetical protein